MLNSVMSCLAATYIGGRRAKEVQRKRIFSEDYYYDDIIILRREWLQSQD